MVDRLRSQATWLVSRAHLRAHTELQRAFDEAGSRPYYFRILAALEETGPISQADLGRAVGLDRSDVAISLDALDAAGLTRRSPDPDDGRRKIVKVTRPGRRELNRLAEVLDRVQSDFLAPLTDSEKARFISLVAKLG